MLEKEGYITLTYRMRFYDKHLDWLSRTVDLYSKVVEHYYSLLSEKLDLLFMSNFDLMRELEIMTVGNREMKKTGEKVQYPLLNFPTVPLYFRRAAINCAISMIRSFQTQKENGKTQPEGKGSVPSLANKFFVAPVYYKGMYKEWKEDSIQLKVYTGEKWVWRGYRFCGRTLPKDAQILSPTISLEKKQAYLHIPVRKTVKDIHLVRERMQVGESILAVSFPGSDSIAVGAVITQEGFFQKAIFFSGGSELKARKNTLKRKLKELEKRQERGKKFIETEFVTKITQQEIKIKKSECKKGAKRGEQYRKKIENINDYYAHLISRRIVEYCRKQKIRVIAVPNYQQAIDFSQKQYLKTDHFEWIGRRIIRYLKYKAFSAGILVSAVPIAHISDCCSECGSKIRRYNEGHKPGIYYFGGQLFLCPNGHRGNSGLNTAKNVGKRFLSYY